MVPGVARGQIKLEGCPGEGRAFDVDQADERGIDGIQPGESGVHDAVDLARQHIRVRAEHTGFAPQETGESTQAPASGPSV
ncbi:MAG: hypothetical protein ACLGI2_00795 [Acidimicrobiia bacterium]